MASPGDLPLAYLFLSPLFLPTNRRGQRILPPLPATPFLLPQHPSPCSPLLSPPLAQGHLSVFLPTPFRLIHLRVLGMLCRPIVAAVSRNSSTLCPRPPLAFHKTNPNHHLVPNHSTFPALAFFWRLHPKKRVRCILSLPTNTLPSLQLPSCVWDSVGATGRERESTGVANDSAGRRFRLEMRGMWNSGEASTTNFISLSLPGTRWWLTDRSCAQEASKDGRDDIRGQRGSGEQSFAAGGQEDVGEIPKHATACH